MKILLLGSGGREHAIAWRLRQDDPGVELFIAPGNAGTARIGTNLPLSATDLAGLLEWAQKEQPDLTVVGPEAPLCAGVVDLFERAGLPIFGPNAAAARLEGSKVYSKNFVLKYGLPTAPGRCFTESAAALAYSRSSDTYPQVLKADGLAAGKGVIIAQTAAEAEETIRRIMDERVFGEAGAQMIIEECSVGREMSVHVITDGVSHVILPIAQDHKRIGENDTGLNTGGMGAYAPAPFATPELKAEISSKIVEPVLSAFGREGIDFRGILYIGLMWTKNGPSIIEFNVRGGDPETQVLLPLIETPLVEIFQAVREQRLGNLHVKFNARHAVSIVMAAEGYPGMPVTGATIGGLDDLEEEPGTKHELLYQTVHAALLEAARKHFGPARDLSVEIDEKTGKITAISRLMVVEAVTAPHDEISLPEARLLKSDVSLGEKVDVDVFTRDFGRIAAQIFKQTLFATLHTTIFHAGTKQAGRHVVTNGGRVLSVTAWAADLASARELAYHRVAKIHFAGSQVRRDIGARLTLE